MTVFNGGTWLGTILIGLVVIGIILAVAVRATWRNKIKNHDCSKGCAGCECISYCGNRSTNQGGKSRKQLEKEYWKL